MQSRSARPILKWLVVLFAFVVGTMVFIPSPQLMAQSDDDTTTPTATPSSDMDAMDMDDDSDMSTSMSADMTATPTASTSPAPGTENWCMNGGPWDDGRCIVPGDDTLTYFYFVAGWCGAQVELGNYRGTVDDCLSGVANQRSQTSSSNATGSLDYSMVNSDGSDFACTVVYDRDNGSVSSMAVWDDQYTDQDQVIFFTNLPGLANYGVNIEEYSLQAGVVSGTDAGKTLSRASASIQQRESSSGDTVGTVGPIDCRIVQS